MDQYFIFRRHKIKKQHDTLTPYFSQFDDFSAAEAELLVVIQHSVHVLDPHSVHWTIKQVPSLVTVTS